MPIGYVLIIASYFGYLVYQELLKLSDVGLFFIFFILQIVGVACKIIPLLFVGVIFFIVLVAALVCEVLAWLKVDHINKA